MDDSLFLQKGLRVELFFTVDVVLKKPFLTMVEMN